MKLELVQVQEPCTVPWSSMKGDERIRRCELCRKDVYNLSGMTRAQAELLLDGSQEKLCVRMVRRADGTVMTSDCTRDRTRALRRAARRSMAFGLAMAAAVAGVLGTAAVAIANEPLCAATRATQSWVDRLAGGLGQKPIDPEHYEIVGAEG